MMSSSLLSTMCLTISNGSAPMDVKQFLKSSGRGLPFTLTREELSCIYARYIAVYRLARPDKVHTRYVTVYRQGKIRIIIVGP